jgi:hypothetical protein
VERVVGRIAGHAEVAAENSGKSVDVAGGEIALGAGHSAEAAEQFERLETEEGFVPIGAAADFLAGQVGAGGYPDFVAGVGANDGLHQIGQGGCPGRTGAFQIVAESHRGMIFRAPGCHSGLQKAAIWDAPCLWFLSTPAQRERIWMHIVFSPRKLIL